MNLEAPSATLRGAAAKSKKTPERVEIEKAIQKAATINHGKSFTRAEILAKAGVDPIVGNKCFSNLRGEQKIVAVKNEGRPNAEYVLTTQLNTYNGKRLTPPCRIDKMAGIYQPELNVLEAMGVTPERIAVTALPSRIGDELHYPGGRVDVIRSAV